MRLHRVFLCVPEYPHGKGKEMSGWGPVGSQEDDPARETTAQDAAQWEDPADNPRDHAVSPESYGS